MAQLVGILTADIITALGLHYNEGEPILLGSGNISHMMKRHPNDYAKYGQFIPAILSHPDYVGQNPSDGSIEYVKNFEVNGEFVKVAVRLSGGNTLFARSLYILNSNRVQNFIQKGTLKRV